MATVDREQIKSELRRARTSLHNDAAALDHEIHVDIPAELSDKAPILIGGAAVLAALIAFGGTKAVKTLAAAGAVGAAALIFIKRNRDSARP